MWLNEVGLELPGKFTTDSARMKKIRQLTDVGRFLNRLLGETGEEVHRQIVCCAVLAAFVACSSACLSERREEVHSKAIILIRIVVLLACVACSSVCWVKEEKGHRARVCMCRGFLDCRQWVHRLDSGLSFAFWCRCVDVLMCCCCKDG